MRLTDTCKHIQVEGTVSAKALDRREPDMLKDQQEDLQ